MKYRSSIAVPALISLAVFGMGCPLGGSRNGEGADEMPVPDAADHFFVDGARGNDANTGRRATPYVTIQTAIDRASTNGGSVFVAGGAYNETIELASAVEIRGGYDSLDWVLDRENFPTMIAGGTTAVKADEVMSARLEGLTILSEDATEPGGSSVAVYITDSVEVTLADLMLFPGNGADGADGEAGEPGGRGADGGDGQDAGFCLGSLNGGEGGATFATFTGGRGGNGNVGVGSDGEDTHPATFGRAAGGSGGDGGGLGGDGSNGGNGDNSTLVALNGAGGAEIGTFEDGAYVPASGGNGGNGATGGAGGGGGGGGGAGAACGGSGGGGGGNGRGGQGGEGGMGGGASIGVLLVTSELVRVENTTIATGAGGIGGTGGDGGAHGTGGLGGNGGDDGFLLGAGGDGGDGGDGAPGASGGGGGPTLGFVQIGDSSLERINTMVVFGTPGAGGMSPAGPDFFGADGLAAELR